MTIEEYLKSTDINLQSYCENDGQVFDLEGDIKTLQLF